MEKPKPVKGMQVAETEEGTESGLGHPYEEEMTSDELSREAERRVEEHQVAHDSRDEEADRKLARDDEDRKKNRVQQKNVAQKAGEKEASKDLLNKETVAQPPKKLSDGFEQTRQDPLQSAIKKMEQSANAAAAAALGQAAPSQRPGKPLDAMQLLHQAKDPGVYYRERGEQEGQGDEAEAEGEPQPEDSELNDAVEEVLKQLAEVKGILRVSPGVDEDGNPVVVVVATRGFGQAELRQCPERVNAFNTIIAIPYELLPLRRER